MSGELKLWYCDIALGLLEAVDRYERCAEDLTDARVRALDPSTRDIEPTEAQALEAFDAAHLVVCEYFKNELVQRTDSFIGWINDTEDLNAARKEKGKEMIAMAKAGEERLRWFKQIVQRVMVEIDKRKLDGVMGQLRIQGNGGPQPVEIRQIELLPPKYMRFMLQLSGEEVDLIRTCGGEASLLAEKAKPIEPDTDLIRAALLSETKCEKCNGIGANHNNSAAIPCDACNATGKVRGSVPGAVLLDRGEHLRVR